MPNIQLSLLLPCYNEIDFIESVLQNALQQDFPQAQMEILVLDGGSTDGTRAVIELYAQKHASIRLIDNPDRYVPQAMNVGIRAAKGDIIMRWDAHAAYPIHYASRLVKYLKKSGAANVGGLWEIAPRDTGKKAEAIAFVLAHPLGVGNATYRLGSKALKEVDTVPFGCFPKTAFEQYGYYDERLRRNQDIELNRRIRRQGGRILLVPDVVITYYARSTYAGLWKNNFANGEWVVRTAMYTGTLDALSLRHFVPLGFALYLLGTILLLLGNPLFPLSTIIYGIIISPIMFYLSLLIAVAFKSAWGKKQGNLFCPLIWSFFLLHISYGLGSLRGLGYFFSNKNRP